ncbi:MAG: hypothetical protein N838_24865 [Thiohalocapsa sp. PB-PSB1]|jgi:hypothetical protein|nr:MAG: hypothetical protein N838_24865 [Thiohalocapsa sp. PB-PSB1]
MSKNSEFRSVEFFRRVRDRNAEQLTNMRSEEIIAFFQGEESANKSVTSDRVLAGRRSSADQPARGGVR